MRKLRMALLFSCILIGTGCSNWEVSYQAKEYDSEEQAFEAAKKENPELKRIVWESNLVGDERMALYFFKGSEGEEGIGTASFLYKNNKVSWNIVANPAVVKNADNKTTAVKVNFTSINGDSYDFYEGVAEKGENTRINTTLEDGIKPHIDKESNLYYYITFGPKNVQGKK